MLECMQRGGGKRLNVLNRIVSCTCHHAFPPNIYEEQFRILIHRLNRGHFPVDTSWDAQKKKSNFVAALLIFRVHCFSLLTTLVALANL